MNLKTLFLYAFVILLFLSGCSATKKSATVPSSKQNATAVTEEQNINATYAYFNGIKEKLTNNQEKAAENFAACLRSDPKNHAAMYELASLYAQQRKYNDALFFAKSAAELDPKNTWYQLLLAGIYEKTGKYGESALIYQKLIKDNPDNIDFYFSEADALLYQNKVLDAIKVYNQVEQRIGINRELILQKERLYLKLGKVNEAAAEVESLIKSEPLNLENYSMLVEIYQANDMNDKALETIHRMQAIDPDDPNVALSLAEYYRSTGKLAESFEELKKVFRSPQLGSDAKLRILTSYLPKIGTDSTVLNQALELSKELSETHPAEANPQAVYGDFLAISKNYEEARKQYRLSLSLDKKNLQAWLQLLIVESELRDFDAMEKESDEALTLYSDQSTLYLFNGIAKSQNKKYEEAAKVLLSGSKLVVDNDAQLVQFYSNLGDTYHNLKKYEESDKYFDKALAIDPNEAYVLNNFAYYLSLRKEKLEKAAEMSKKSNELTPHNANNEDTYAWVLYTQGKYQEALDWLDKALKDGGDKNGTIIEHYGDVLFKLGRTDEALTNWLKAKQTGDHSEMLDRKIADKKLYE